MNDHPEIPPPPPWPEPGVTGLVEVTDEPIAFTPVPRLRKRRDGWTELAQRAFIAAQNPPSIPRALSSKLSKLPAPGARHGWGAIHQFGRRRSLPLVGRVWGGGEQRISSAADAAGPSPCARNGCPGDIRSSVPGQSCLAHPLPQGER